MRRFFCDASSGLVPTADEKLIADPGRWRRLALAGNGPSGLSPTDIPLVDNRRKRFVYLSTIPADQTRLGLNN